MKTTLPILILLFASFAFADAEQTQVLSKLRTINQLEIKAGQLAQEKGVTDDVKSYAQNLITDHKQLDMDVTSYAKKNKVTVADEEMSEADKATLATLQSSTGADFDKQFLASMVKGHEDAIDMVKTARLDTKDPRFKSFLASVYVNLEKHENAAKKIEKKVSL